MTAIKHPKAAAAIVLGALVALATLAGPASARWYGNEHYDNGWHGNEHYNGYYYRPPPVVYGTPYYNGYYYPPPVIYDNQPGITIRLF
ncbi:MAG: hypothetical protein ACHQK9_07755 [Reyranellales bacterium]